VIAALFTIGVSADTTLYNAVGRIIGAFLGVGLGLRAALTVGGSILSGLVVATAAANAVATVWPSLRYAAVTAAMVALDPTPELDSSLARAGAVMLGTLAGTAATLVVLPVFGRQRVTDSLVRILQDCQRLLDLIPLGLETDERYERDAVHGSLLKHLESARSQLSSTRFRARLPSGAPLRDAVVAAESLWHAIVVLDRAVSSKRHDIAAPIVQPLEAALFKVRDTTASVLSGLKAALRGSHGPTCDLDELADTLANAGEEIDRQRRSDHSRRETKALDTLEFSLSEIDRSLRQLVGVVDTRDETSRARTSRRRP
jgi:uncharacterized membrane protein YccC